MAACLDLDAMATFAEKLRSYLHDKGIPQKALAARSGVAPTTGLGPDSPTSGNPRTYTPPNSRSSEVGYYKQLRNFGINFGNSNFRSSPD